MTAKTGKIAVDLYYDVISPYAWIAFEGLIRYQQIWPIAVNYKLFSLRDIMLSTGNKAPLVVKNKFIYEKEDLRRNNEFWGMDIKLPKDFKAWISNPESTTSAQKILLTIQEEQPEMLGRTSRIYWDRMYTKGLPIFNEEDHEIILKTAGFTDPTKFIQLSTEEKYEKQLKQNTDEALDLKAFGAPWIVVYKDGKQHCFFGSDRFHHIAHLIGETFTSGKKEFDVKL